MCLKAKVHSLLLDELGIEKVFAVVGASMGGMQALEFAAQFPDRVQRVVSLCATGSKSCYLERNCQLRKFVFAGQTSPATVALRSVQRRAVKLDPRLPAAIALLFLHLNVLRFCAPFQLSRWRIQVGRRPFQWAWNCAPVWDNMLSLAR